jgi:hypothetical protein
LLLRAVMGWLALLFAVTGWRCAGWLRWLNGAVALSLAVTLAPPIEFIRAPGGLDDPNYQQSVRLMLATLAALGVTAWWRWQRGGINGWIAVVPALVAIGCAVGGVAAAFGILSQPPLRVATSIGLGVVVTSTALAGYAVCAWRWRTRHGASA